MSLRNRWSIILLLALLPLVGFGQTKSDLQKQREALTSKIALTKQLIGEAKKSQQTKSQELKILNQQIRLRQQLINNINSEITEIDREVKTKQGEITSLEKEVELMKDEYSKMVYQSYKNRNATDRLMFIFSSGSFNQAYARLKMMQRYAEVRKKQTEEIKAKQLSLEGIVIELQDIRSEKLGLAESQKSESAMLDDDKKDQQKELNKLKSQEDDLRKQQRKQESERKKINRAISKIIEAELAAEKSKNGGRFELTPEGKIISENFEKNKGNLPWPVLRGVITQKFGQQPHPTLGGITIDSKGIDIATEPGSKAYAIFGGEVTSVFSIPGAGQNVIITHGAYKTVYTNLKTCLVTKGDIVSTKETMGELLEDGSQAKAHIEVWKITSKGGTPLNPEYWISKL